MNCLHVVVKATRQELHDMGVCSEESFKLLLSGRALPVKKKERAGNGKVMVYLDHPDPARDIWLWVYEEFTEGIP